MGLCRIVLLSLCCLMFFVPAPSASESDTPPEQISIGTIEHFESTILGETRPLEIHLPAHHAETNRAYPLLLVLDGGDWFSYMVTVQNMIAPNHFPEMVVVGIPNTDRSRDLDILDESLGEPGAGAQRFTRFLNEELFPHLAETYRASSFRVLAGHSLAASFVVHTLYTSPGLFQGYIATSPSLLGRDRAPVFDREYRSLIPVDLSGKFLFISAGGMEPPELAEALEDLATDVEGRTGLDLDFYWRVYPTEGHVPVKGFYEGLRLLFSDWFPPRQEFLDADWDGIRAHYRQLSRRFSFQVDPPFDIAASVANRLDRAGDSVGAKVVFRDLVKTYPAIEWARERLAELEMNGLEGPNLGQEPPGRVPEPFAPFLAPAPDNKHGALSFSPDGTELYFSVYRNSEFPQKIMFTRQVDEGWSIPQVAPFSGTYQEGGPVFSPDGDRIYFYSRRPLPDTEVEAEKSDVWFVERDDENGWSEPMHLSGPINSEHGEAVAGFAGDGSLLITRFKDRKAYLLESSLGENGRWAEPRLVKLLQFDDTFFSPIDLGSDDFRIFDVNKKMHGPWYNAYLYISFRNQDGTWTVPKNMGDMINRGEGRFPSFSPDGKYLFFTSYRTGNAEYYWVDAGIIDYLRTHDLNLVELLTEEVRTDGIEAATSLHARFRDLHSGWYTFDGKLFDDVADELIATGDAASAIEVLTLNQSLYPDDGQLIRSAKLAALQQDLVAMSALREEFQNAGDLGEDELNSWGRFLVRSGQVDAAQMIFELDRATHPWSPWAYAGLASVLEEMGDVTGARDQLTTAIGLDPGNSRFRERLENLEE